MSLAASALAPSTRAHPKTQRDTSQRMSPLGEGEHE
jgi:hypothetical protein